MTVNLTPTEVIRLVSEPLAGLPACIAGSSVAAEAHGLPLQNTSDVDVFCYSEQSLIAATQRLLDAGHELNDRFVRVWDRWLRYGLKSWHTNSIKFEGRTDIEGLEINIVHKLVGGHPMASLSQVLESFDFGLLGMGYDLYKDEYHDLRPYLFPNLPLSGPLPLMPNKRADWRQGFISQYNGMREVGRYAKYVRYGHDLSAVKDDLIEGYLAASLYLSDKDDAAKQQLGEIYGIIAAKIEEGNIDELAEAGNAILYLDSLDQIMEALE